AEVGSNESIDNIKEDLGRDRSTMVTGYVGKSSDLQWWQRSKQEVEKLHRRDGEYDLEDRPYGSPGERRLRQRPESRAAIAESDYHLDDENLSVFEHIDPYELPDDTSMVNLHQHYLDACSETFPIINADRLGELFDIDNRKLPIAEREDMRELTNLELAIVNLVLAIGSRYAHLISEAQGQVRVDVLYYSRAKRLGLTANFFIEHATWEKIQLATLTSFYFLSIGHMSHAWMMTGHAVRSAYGMGLHVRNDDPDLDHLKKEQRIRGWWAVFLIDKQVSSITGRPTSVIPGSCSTPLPVPFSEADIRSELSHDVVSGWTDKMASQNVFQQEAGHIQKVAQLDLPPDGQYLQQRILLAVINQRAMTELYAPSTTAKSWSEVQLTIVSLLNQLDGWRDNLPPGLKYDANSKGQSTPARTLGFHYNSIKMAITRPCVCRLDRRIPNQSSESHKFNNDTAKVCVTAAQTFVHQLRHVEDVQQLYKTGPWYCLIHMFMQAASILMLELTLQGVHLHEAVNNLVPMMKRLMIWLRDMGRDNHAAEKAYRIAFGVLRKVAPAVKIDISE
ncbi:hypothetical protein K402DRAFT_307080, partial [Aulographum hederae CBS 113979]